MPPFLYSARLPSAGHSTPALRFACLLRSRFGGAKLAASLTSESIPLGTLHSLPAAGMALRFKGSRPPTLSSSVKKVSHFCPAASSGILRRVQNEEPLVVSSWVSQIGVSNRYMEASPMLMIKTP